MRLSGTLLRLVWSISERAGYSIHFLSIYIFIYILNPPNNFLEKKMQIVPCDSVGCELA